MIKKIFLILVFVGTFTYFNGLDNFFLKFLEKKCKTLDGCSLNMKGVISEDWSSLYYFDNGAILNENKRLLPFIFPHNDVNMLHSRILFFVKDNTLVKSIYIKNGIENFQQNDVFIDLYGPNQGYGVYTPDTSFTVHIVDSEGEIYYNLVPNNN